MRVARIGSATDALATSGVVFRRREPGRECLDAPERRAFWYGHGFVLDAPPAAGALTKLIAEGRQRYGACGAERFVIQWEVPYPASGAAPAAPAGCDVERSVAMTYAGPPAAPDPRVRDLTGEQWDAAVLLARTEYAASADHTAGRIADYRMLVARRAARFVGITDADGRLAAMAGMVRDARYARFLIPVTRPDARGRGWFSACARTLVAWGRADAAREVVIVVDPATGPEALYRRLGFVPATCIDAIVVPL